MPVDPRRLARALTLRVDRLADGRHVVSGGQEPHVVDLETAPACHCADARFRDTRCAHVLAVQLEVLEPELRSALRELVAAQAASVLCRQSVGGFGWPMARAV
jgi:hypothetical protein